MSFALPPRGMVRDVERHEKLPFYKHMWTSSFYWLELLAWLLGNSACLEVGRSHHTHFTVSLLLIDCVRPRAECFIRITLFQSPSGQAKPFLHFTNEEIEAQVTWFVQGHTVICWFGVLTQVRVTTQLELFTTLGYTIALVPWIMILYFWFEWVWSLVFCQNIASELVGQHSQKCV